MGRYYYFSNGDKGKFWFACQPTSDLMEFGGSDYNEGKVNWCWNRETDLPIVNRVLKETHDLLVKETPYTYKSFMRKMRRNGYLSSTSDKETQTEAYCRASKLCAKINLGLKIRRGLRREDFLSCEGEC